MSEAIRRLGEEDRKRIEAFDEALSLVEHIWPDAPSTEEVIAAVAESCRRSPEELYQFRISRSATMGPEHDYRLAAIVILLENTEMNPEEAVKVFPPANEAQPHTEADDVCAYLMGGYYRRKHVEPVVEAAREILGNPLQLRSFYRGTVERTYEEPAWGVKPILE